MIWQTQDINNTNEPHCGSSLLFVFIFAILPCLLQDNFTHRLTPYAYTLH